MRTKLAIASGMLLTLLATAARAQTFAFTYQGELKDAGDRVTGTYDFQFRLYATSVGGSQIGSESLSEDVPVQDGLFSTNINFGLSPFSGSTRWLEIGVRPGASTGGYQLLAPRQLLTPVPYALHSAAPWRTVTLGVSYPDGNVGIGIGSTEHRLDVGGRTRVRQNSPPTPDNTAGIWFHQAGTGDRAFIGMRDDNTIGLYGIGGGGWGAQMNVATGNLGVGTGTPAAKLDVRGDIRLGPSGQYFAPGSGENLRIVRGMVSQGGVVLGGTGFTAARQSTGWYLITFNPPFANTPTITTAAEYDAGSDLRFVQTQNPNASQTQILVGSSSGDWEDSAFHFIAIGPR